MKKLTVILSLLSVLFFSCKKEKDDAPTYVAEGTYVGKIGSGSQIPSGSFAIKLKPNGLLDRISDNGTVSATGTWQLTGSAFTAHYESATVKVDLTGTLTESQKRIQGSWESTNGNGGSFYAVKE